MADKQLSKKLIKSKNPDEIKDIVDLFNLNIQKQNIIRSSKLSELQDKVTTQMEKRLDNNADQFSNRDLIEYLKTIQSILDKSSVDPQEVSIPTTIAIQNNITVKDSASQFDRDSRERIKDTLESILSQVSIESTAEEVEDIDEEKNLNV